MSAANPGGAERSRRGAAASGGGERGRRARGRGAGAAGRGGRRGAARRDGRLAAVCEALGVTRVARVTGLDRTGVEVACAVRPGGHVLQVSNGKGATFEEATDGALLEACEL